ncbi:MAG: type II toxin-antitoxin system RelE/ParE family toxin [Nitrospira sp. CR1.3]|nr:type II toxin-antitoxin system RelE/ParE family toxin [Nitrospira sp. CR1.3]
MAQVRWSVTSETDLQDIEDFIARDSVLHAVTFVGRIVELAERLLKSPQIGRIVPEFNRPDLREVILRGYRIVYLLQNGEILILRVVHGARDLSTLVHREPWDLGN